MKIKAIAGRNGSGKTQYVEQLRKQLASDKVRYIAFADSYGPNVDNQYYLQLRWNQHDIDHETPTVGDLLETAFLMTGDDTPERREMQRQLYSMFHMDESLDKYIITLSSGELRKFQLTKTLFANPKLLIMDNPFIGLDAETRDQLKELLLLLATERNMELILVLAKTDDIPEYVTDVVETRFLRRKPSVSPLETISFPRRNCKLTGTALPPCRHMYCRKTRSQRYCHCPIRTTTMTVSAWWKCITSLSAMAAAPS